MLREDAVGTLEPRRRFPRGEWVWYNLGMKFSLIVTAHNEGALLEATLKSVFRAVLGEDAGAGGEEGLGRLRVRGVGGSSEVASDRGWGLWGAGF